MLSMSVASESRVGDLRDGDCGITQRKGGALSCSCLTFFCFQGLVLGAVLARFIIRTVTYCSFFLSFRFSSAHCTVSKHIPTHYWIISYVTFSLNCISNIEVCKQWGRCSHITTNGRNNTANKNTQRIRINNMTRRATL